MSTEPESKLIVLTPVEYDKRRIVRYYGYKLSSLDPDSILSTLEEVNVREMPKVWQEGDVIFYQYPRQPLIAIRNGQFFTTREMWGSGEFSHRKIRHQASILLRILGREGLATYNRKAVPRKRFTPHKWREKSNQDTFSIGR
jgi:hypothetical protein